MNWGLLLSGFGLGTFKFLFAQWSVYGLYSSTVQSAPELGIMQIFFSVTIGAWVSAAIFFFLSGILMKRAKEKRLAEVKKAFEEGREPKIKKTFTKMNRLIVWIKHRIGIYGVTLLAPLFLSVPIGSIVCAKFYGHKRRTFPLMMFFTATYSALICLWIYATL